MRQRRGSAGSGLRLRGSLLCLVVVATAAIVMGALATAGEAVALVSSGRAESSAHDPLGIIVTGDQVRAAGTTYSGDAFWLTKTELAALKESRGVLAGHPGLWTTRQYSFCENHGTPVYGWATAAGIDLEALLGDAGLTVAEIADLGSVTVTAAPDSDGFSSMLDLDVSRFLFDAVGATSGATVDPILALYVDEVESYAALPADAGTAVDGAYTTLLFGQLTTAESNRCSFVKDASLISLPTSSPALTVDAPDAFATSEADRQSTLYSLADLVSRGDERRTFDVAGAAYSCDGLALGKVLDEARGAICPQDRIVVTTSSGTLEPGLTVADAGDVLVAYFSRSAGGTAVANGTQIMLYGDGLAIADVLAVRIVHVDATAALRLTSPTASQSKATVAAGHKLALRAVATKAQGATEAGAVSWTSSASRVAVVDAAGNVTAKRPGSAVIKAASGAVTRSFTVSVVARSRVARSVVLPRAKTLVAGATARLAVRVSPAAATTTISWRSGSRQIATVDRGGLITALKRGRTTIVVRTSNGKTARCVLTVK